ncbi:undecaprenyldiphospho-muramoylpentapeptide beta-N-acetylglucosaminyltransferase [Aetokthonos hydrillicola Thurmond2011]|jgi:UDP-N-acetylglucosamine--N-acetylmuramyl-(pentapeptide) pyrophosphoryl-undecaprenol N-acetylglucosamine transferase|uniref:UDP-N-acetylglucosamine--N-acetylmuramyl-(pentapeptide) pyrophosphoryl-undecaprenol N-acetylglucosamine transferase n=1 Tax=Aetokthonos hydrillicola Thurmond2011 TaxID=2712845 RepID=A0AAP5I8G6_9CYAN|nr:undecaprenyldiphospho-muramoylpentapeptide beta-N-acetylglucosaminyltransferase [Aetokthonos hydrillicola]MBO3463007.1 undecaprenyldiphospho-muramoylpentapeptide beta-N-acetylglucosaminyltransferase [Aetokthonos hydrillicola CCALA 1050]MBW4587190.1 undecaprenyldiphospho-muramoylpentapeptide beta-N-acetylglucosaminyltransferase [Aetokthonos hydrillicola CCALA 1050]MDR9896786.1 undecaprenyldiphospho-muramoylpentapeptide beta-N-acetylglucosaminyltransferase [Aetokthonos hydrillicola Thurmond2011
MVQAPKRLLIAASGTGGHLFPAIALAKKLPDYQIEWLGVPNRLETQLVPQQYPLNTIAVEGFQKGFRLSSLGTLGKLISSIMDVRKLLKQGKFQGVFTTGGYIAAPAVIAARSLGLPVILHESNALPGKVTRFFGPWCSSVAVGFEVAAKYLHRSKTVYTGTPVRSQFLDEKVVTSLDLPIPDHVPLIVVFGGSQGALALNKLVRESATAWFEAGAWIVHLTGDKDPEMDTLQHPQYICLPFYDNMAALLHRANLAISRSGAGSLTELAVCGTPAILIPYPFAAEDHQTYNAQVFTSATAALMFQQSDLNAVLLKNKVLSLLHSPEDLRKMGENARAIAVVDSAEKLAHLLREVMES